MRADNQRSEVRNRPSWVRSGRVVSGPHGREVEVGDNCPTCFAHWVASAGAEITTFIAGVVVGVLLGAIAVALVWVKVGPV